MEAKTTMDNEKKSTSEPTGKGATFYIVCPCECGRAYPVKYTPGSSDVSELGNKLWQNMASEKGLEGAIEFLHVNADAD